MLKAISVPLLCKEEVKDLQSSLLFPLKLSGFSVPCTNIKQKAYDLVSSLKNSMSLDDCNTMEDQETMERRVYLGLSMAGNVSDFPAASTKLFSSFFFPQLSLTLKTSQR